MTETNEERIRRHTQSREFREWALYRALNSSPATPEEVMEFLTNVAPPEVFTIIAALMRHNPDPRDLPPGDPARELTEQQIAQQDGVLVQHIVGWLLSGTGDQLLRREETER